VLPAAPYQYDQEEQRPHHGEFCTAALSTEKPAVRPLHFKGDEQQFYQKQQRKWAGEEADCDADGPH